MSRHVLIDPERRAPTRVRDDEPDLVRAYLDEIGRTPLLDAAAEVELAQRIEAGLYAAELLRQHVMEDVPLRGDVTAEELSQLVEDGNRAKDHMLRANLRLVVAVARKYSGRDVPFLDIVQEGNLGLIRSVEKFDYRKGFKFSTYATWWIRQAIQRGMAETARVVRLPVHVVEEMNKLFRVERELSVQLGRDPSPEELAEVAETTPERVVELRRLRRGPISLDSPVGEDEETPLGDIVADTATPSAADLVTQQALRDELARVVHTLPAREAAIVELRYGLRDGRPRTLEEVAREFGLTRERIRQLEKISLARLRHPSNSEQLLAWAS
jgi:RNA polymerase primary sigma factor